MAIPAMSQPLTSLFNLSLQLGKLPELWSNSIVTPIYKSGDHAQPTNYRPISITSCVLKLLERCISDQLKAHLREIKFLRPHQFGFRAGHSCESCLLKIVHDCKSALDHGDCVGLVCIDLSKAFDSLPIDGLLCALASAGLDTAAISWFRCYLTGRKQQVRSGAELSNLEPVSFGVPQGSILGPLLFTIFVNELPLQCHNTEPSLFADDTTIVAFGKTPADVQAKLEADLRRLAKWFHNNCLKANSAKSDFLFMTNKKLTPPTITFGNAVLSASDHIKILGFLLDSDLSMRKHVESVIKKARSGTYAIRLASRFVDLPTKKLMCDALVCSHFNYCDSVLGQANKTDLDRLQVAQNNAVRAIVGAHPLASAAKIRDQLGWLSLEGKRRVHMATTVWKAVDANVNPNADAPQALSDLVRPVGPV